MHLLFEGDFEYVRIVGHEVRFQAAGYEVGQFGKIVAVLFGKNDARDAASFGLNISSYTV